MKDLTLDESNAVFETAACLNPLHKPVALSDVSKYDHEKAIMELSGADTDYFRQEVAKGSDRTRVDIADWLGPASEKYEISSNLRDYVVVPVPMIPSDLPNRNLVAFPFRRLTEFSPSMGTLQYRTWRSKPTHIEHQNKDFTKAKGVIFDVSMARVKGAQDDVWKVIGLCGFDRTKDPILANAILTGERNAYSMGAYVNGYGCSCCGEVASRPDQPRCDHVDPRRRELRVRPVNGVSTLAYWNVVEFAGFELSSVADPAFRGATTDHLINIGG